MIATVDSFERGESRVGDLSQPWALTLMGKKKKATSTNVLNPKQPSAQSAKQGVKGDPDPVPLGQYASLIGMRTLLLLFCMAIMPRSTFVFKELPPQASSQDRPQAEWMAPITALPEWSVGWMCVGAAAVQTYCATRLRTWVMSDEGIAEVEEAGRRMKVRFFRQEAFFWS